MGIIQPKLENMICKLGNLYLFLHFSLNNHNQLLDKNDNDSNRNIP